MSYKFKKNGLSVVLAILFFTSSSSASGAIAGATEPTQLIRWASEAGIDVPQQILQVQHAYSQLMTMRQNLKHLSEGDWLTFINLTLKLKKLVAYQDALAYTGMHYDEQFKSRYKDYDQFVQMASAQTGIADFSKTYQEINKSTHDTVHSALKQLHLSVEEMEDDQALVEKLKGMAKDAVGQKQAMEVASQIALHSSEQMKKLQKVQMAQTQIQAAWIAKQNAKDEIQAATESLRKRRPIIDTNSINFKY